MPFKKLKGRKLMLVNMVYTKPTKFSDWKDYLTVTYRDLITGQKEIQIIEDPEITIYVVKDEYRTFKKPRHFLSMDRLEPKSVKYKNVLYEIAKIAGPDYVAYYNEHTSFKDRKQLFKYPYVLGGDIDIITYYMVLWNEQCGNNDRKAPTKAYMDIEVDQIDYTGSIARQGECEINAITIIDDSTNISYTMLYDNGRNPQIKTFKENQEEFQKTLHENFDDSYGVLDYRIYMFDNEREMIEQAFKLIHSINPDLMLIWNMAFDIPYIIARIQELGLDPREIMCRAAFPMASLFYYEDKRTFDFASKKDYFQLSDSLTYLCQLINYSALRKSKGVVRKVNLGAVAQKELKDNKLDYSDSGNIRTLPYENYVKFVLYNIKDVLLQMGIERKNKDMDNLYIISTENNIAYKDAIKQTVTFRGLLYGDLRENGIILGHNANFDQGNEKYDEDGEYLSEDDDDESFEGAINGDPMLNKANGVYIYGARSQFLYRLSVDFDFSAMYPNIIVVFNIFATTMIGKLIIAEGTIKASYDEDLGKEYIEDLIHGDPCFIGTKWHGLSDIETLYIKLNHKYGGAH